jgi:hypothetical protein
MGLFDDYLGAAEAPAAPRPSLDPRSRDLAIRTVLGEAANEPEEGQAGVAAVIRNRVQAGRYGGADVPSVVLKPYAFEPWGNPEARAGMMAHRPEDPKYQQAGQIVDRVFGEGYDPTGGATHFYSPTAQAALGRQPPKWAQGQEPQNIGRHAFYAPEGRVQSTEVSAQARRPATGLFDDYLSPPAPSAASPAPVSGPPVDASPPADTGGRFTDNPGQSFRTAREGVSPAVADKTRGAYEGFAKSATFNFRDEIQGLLAAGGFDFDKKDSPADVALMKGAYKLATGDPDAVAAYRAATSQGREQAQRVQEQQPGSFLGGEILGTATSLPLGGAPAAGAGAVARAGQAARIGAGAGALAGAGEGTDLESRAKGAATGGVIGGTIGAVASPVVDLGGPRAAWQSCARGWPLPIPERRAPCGHDG